MTKKALKHILDAILARLEKAPNNHNWYLLKQRPTQFGSAKNRPGHTPEFWSSVKQDQKLLTYLVDKKETTNEATSV